MPASSSDAIQPREGRTDFGFIGSVFTFLSGIWRLYPIVLCLILWEVASRSGWVNQILLPPPSRILRAMIVLSGFGPQGGPNILLSHAAQSLLSIAIGYSLATVSFLTIGLLMGMNRVVYGFFNPLVSALLPIPTIALIPLVILWLGLTQSAVIFVVFLSAIFPIVYNAAAGVRSIPVKFIWAARTTGASWFQVFRMVIFPGALPYIITGQRLAFGNAWRGLVAAEMLASTGHGLGFMIFQARTFMDTETIYAGIIVISILGVILERVIWGGIERVTVERWGMSRSSR